MNDNSLLRRSSFALTILLLLPSPLYAKTRIQDVGFVQTIQSKFRLVRSISGSKGHEQAGRYVIDDPRTVFKVPDDQKVLVYAEWECINFKLSRRMRSFPFR